MKTGIPLLLAVSILSAQSPTDNGPGAIRVTTTLVQLDAIVTDGSDRPVPGLTRGDFQILQDGKPMPIVSFSLVSSGPRLTPPVKGAPPRQLKREQVRRTIALVVDDYSLNASTDPGRPDVPNYQTTNRVREALVQIIDRDTREGDLMAVLTLGKHAGAFEQFTTDRELLKSNAARVTFNPMQLMMRSAMESIGGAGLDGTANGDDRSLPLDKLQEASIAALQGVIDGMRRMPGRKSILLIATRLGNRNPATSLAIRQLTLRANRAGITIYTVDPRDPPMAGDRYSDEPQINLASLAADTGGRSWGPQGNIADRLSLALADQESYYLLGYNPGDESFDRKFHKIEIKVLKSGLRVRSRSGFDGLVETPEIEPRDRAGILSKLLTSPYQAATVRTMLSTFYSADGGNPTLRSVVFIDGHDLQAERAPDGTYKGGVEMMVAIVDPNGEILGQTARGFRFSLNADQWRRASETGMAYVIPHPAKEPGPYQVRLAVRDTISGDKGSAATFLDIPNLKKSGLTLSGVALLAPPSEADPYPLSNPAARTFRQGREIAWLAEAYNGKTNSKVNDGLPQLQTSVRVLREGRIVISSAPEPAHSKKAYRGQGCLGPGRAEGWKHRAGRICFATHGSGSEYIGEDTRGDAVHRFPGHSLRPDFQYCR